PCALTLAAAMHTLGRGTGAENLRLFDKVKACIQLVRPAQWVKNVFVFAAWGFSDKRFEPHALLTACVAFLAFSLLSAAVYAFNDMRDYREDALHPTKRYRPVACGRITPATAGALAIVLTLIGVIISFRLGVPFLLTAVSYLLLNLFYSLGAKRLVLL